MYFKQLGGGIIENGTYGGITDLSFVRWVQDGKEYAIVGNTPLEILYAFGKDIYPGS